MNAPTTEPERDDEEPGEEELNAARASALNAIAGWASRSHVAINRTHQAMREALNK